MPDNFPARVRLTKITPSEPSAIQWRRKGEGMGGDVIRGVFSKDKLPVGAWSPPVKVATFAGRGAVPGKMFLTVTAGSPGRTRREADGRRVRVDYSTGAEFEVEFRLGAKVVKTLRLAGPDGGTVGVVIPAYRLAGGKTPADPGFLAELTGLLEYATRRAEWLESLPWSRRPRPRRYAIINNIGGYGCGMGYGIRHTDRSIVAAECRALRQLGVNGFRSPPEFLAEMVRRRRGFAADFGRGWITHVMGYPVPAWRAGRAAEPEAGCPCAPGVKQRTAEGVKQSLEVLQLPPDEVWGLTVDEIGTVVDRSPEGKGHLSVCPRCAEGFREFVKGQGLAPGDFGKRTWGDVRPAGVFRPRASAGPRPKPGPTSTRACRPSRACSCSTRPPADAPSRWPTGPIASRPAASAANGSRW